MATSLHGTDDGSGFGVKGEALGQGDGVVGTTRGPGKSGIRGIHTGHTGAIAIGGELDFGIAAIKGLTGEGAGFHTGILGGAVGVWGDSSAGPGVSGSSSVSAGVIGQGTIGVLGATTTVETEEVLEGVRDFAGFFVGKVGVDGDLNVNRDVTALGDLKVNRNATVVGDLKVNRNATVVGDLNVDHDILVKGDVKLVGGDLAEEFTVVGDLQAEPGSVVVLAGDDSVRVSDQPYDRRVAGVVSGAGSRRPGLIFDHQSGSGRRPLALTGKVWCKVDADWAPVELGDLLTTSHTPGYAMRATDPTRAFGAVIGKALGGLSSGRGLVPVLVALQ
jgi:hypothetical protein